MARYEAIGLIETFGLVFALEAADVMCKAADVDVIGYENVASGYISVLVRGDVGACKTAVDAGINAVNSMEGANLYSHVVIARPHEDLEKILKRYSLKVQLGEE
ncbi:BMC domain-containing protein [Sedimentibacter sp. zth1]|uniref:BMC domain-containing protein n=1 Tax=Sedimentibacter sp. zth1 TaxID=2816908 RepID=UPI001A92ECB8|nr:BMC domain-containing protein [Sedimentibacter sp. zth1]QSX05613.1 BMC domain-containing protein [Sedimentibacter sp. zth1]